MNAFKTFKTLGLVTVVILALQGCGFWPPYNVWAMQKEGEAELAKAESTRRTTVLEAEAKRDSAKALAEAEVARAHGVADANTIIASSLKGNEAYLHYLWITEVASVARGDKTVVYVPTEANLPILESQRLAASAPGTVPPAAIEH